MSRNYHIWETIINLCLLPGPSSCSQFMPCSCCPSFASCPSPLLPHFCVLDPTSCKLEPRNRALKIVLYFIYGCFNCFIRLQELTGGMLGCSLALTWRCSCAPTVMAPQLAAHTWSCRSLSPPPFYLGSEWGLLLSHCRAVWAAW